MKRLLLSLAVVAAVSSLAVGSTFAVFSDQEVVAGNTVSMGTLDLTVNKSAGKPFEITNAYPGWESDWEWIDLYNTGTLPFEAQMRFVRTGGSATLYNKLNITLKYVGYDSDCTNGDDGEKLIYSGPLNAYPTSRVVSSEKYWHQSTEIDGSEDAFWGKDNIPVGITERVCQKVSIDPSAGNNIMGTTVTFNEVVDALQDND